MEVNGSHFAFVQIDLVFMQKILTLHEKNNRTKKQILESWKMQIHRQK